ncbi:hypothetical protein I551_4277 [Mycobacterium ulcerans str. Harvey]|uniref:Uncharacterized protein n=1 Tax=Mycobacterium ulcerans str. Harvey TaxID=1299332 RepID=A0ABN0QX44_MYCUL|nr:hypothetical protein I551_4277 [Mycobacterium ulcerans str. Harvey]
MRIHVHVIEYADIHTRFHRHVAQASFGERTPKAWLRRRTHTAREGQRQHTNQ